MLQRLWIFCLAILVGCGAVSDLPAETPSAPLASPNITATATITLPTAVPTLTPATPPASPTAPAASPTALPASPTTPPASPTQVAQPSIVAPSYPAEVLFTRNGALIALDPANGRERVLAAEARDVAVDAAGRQIAVAYGQAVSIISRDDGETRTLVSGRAVYGMSWAPDGLSLAFAAADDPPTLPLDWERWSRWCATATVYIVDLPTASEREIGPGCDPVFAPDGRRLAYTTSPAMQPDFLPFPGQTNAIRLINRAGANAWNFATADGSPRQGYLVYGPTWSPDARQVAYQRFLGYQALVDINLTMIAGSSEGGGVPALAGAGWHRPPAFAPDGQTLASVEYNFSDARGFTGYDVWSLSIIALQGERREMLPGGDLTLRGQLTARIPRVTAAAWSPDGNALAVIVPSAWNPDADRNAPLYAETTAGEIWQLSPQGEPQRRLTTLVDYASPLIWAPAGWATAQMETGAVMFPADWEVLPATQVDELVAVGNGRLVGRRAVIDPAAVDETTWPQLVADWVTVTQAEAPYRLPDGSRLITFTGQAANGSAIAGVARIGDGAIIVSCAPQAEWPLYRATGIALAIAAR